MEAAGQLMQAKAKGAAAGVKAAEAELAKIAAERKALPAT